MIVFAFPSICHGRIEAPRIPRWSMSHLGIMCSPVFSPCFTLFGGSTCPQNRQIFQVFIFAPAVQHSRPGLGSALGFGSRSRPPSLQRHNFDHNSSVRTSIFRGWQTRSPILPDPADLHAADISVFGEPLGRFVDLAARHSKALGH